MKLLPLLFYLLIFEPVRKNAINGTFMISLGFATFENVCFLTSYGTSSLLRLMIRGFGTGAMHIGCGMVVSVGLFYLWEQAWLQAVGAFALLCFVITLHAVFNILVNQSGPAFWVGCAIPLMMMFIYLLFLRNKTDPS